MVLELTEEVMDDDSMSMCLLNLLMPIHGWIFL